MQSILLRIDDRLLHGQVLVAWAGAMQPDRVVLASDDVAEDPVRRGIYAGLGEWEFEVEVKTLAETVEELQKAHATGKRVLVVCGSPADALRLVKKGADVGCVNVGGLHYAESKRKLLDYVFLSRQDTEDLRTLLARGVELEARDLPTSRGVKLEPSTLDRMWS